MKALLVLLTGLLVSPGLSGASTLSADTFAATEEALSQHAASRASVDDLLLEIEQFSSEEGQQREQSSDDLSSQLAQVNRLLRDVNARQLEELTARLEEVERREESRRQREKDLADTKIITQSEVEELLDPETLLASSDSEIAEWVLEEILEQELPQLVQKNAVIDESSTCVSPSAAGNEVISAIDRYGKDGIGLKDHALGGRIVHQFTSDTYTPPPEPSQLLGNVSWRRFIPEDWEQWLLPNGWENWDVRVPSEFSHLLRSSASATSPPEAILHPNTMPGSCWPMKGRSGQVMIALPYPVRIKAITLDHVKGSLLPESEEQLKSAPKKIQVIGYPECPSDSNCHGLPFDPNDETVLAKALRYDIEPQRTSAQSFSLSGSADAEETGSCSAVTLTCDGGAASAEEDAYAAIQVKILENYGNEDYTCLYRVRVHGDPVE